MRILIVDDHPVYRDGLAAVIAQAFAGAQVDQAADAASAFETLAHRSDFDLVLLDLAMPGLDGRAALPWLRRRHPALPVVVISASDDTGVAAECIACGASGFIPKSARRDTIVAALRAVIDGGAVLAPAAHRALAPPGLTQREAEVLRHLGAGESNKAIARGLGISEATVRVHLGAVYRELGVASRTQALLEARRRGLLAG
ncbi:MAG: response regulator transcription factor [Burkholderiaceae bacterium]|nr:response regulator transcription factor [Burkholderiaceae bacterium]